MTGKLWAWVEGDKYMLSRFPKENPHFAARPFNSRDELSAEAERRGCEVVWQE